MNQNSIWSSNVATINVMCVIIHRTSLWQFVLLDIDQTLVVSNVAAK
jgi:hypothetical protein